MTRALFWNMVACTALLVVCFGLFHYCCGHALPFTPPILRSDITNCEGEDNACILWQQNFSFPILTPPRITSLLLNNSASR